MAIPLLLFFLTLLTTTLANGPFYGACVVGILRRSTRWGTT